MFLLRFLDVYSQYIEEKKIALGKNISNLLRIRGLNWNIEVNSYFFYLYKSMEFFFMMNEINFIDISFTCLFYLGKRLYNKIKSNCIFEMVFQINSTTSHNFNLDFNSRQYIFN